MKEAYREDLSPHGQHMTERRSVAERTYELWLQRGCPTGSELRDWLEAEREVDRGLLSGEIASTVGCLIHQLNHGEHISRRAVIQASPQRTVRETVHAIIVIDQEGRIADFDRSAEAMFGFRREEALGQRLSNLIISPAFRDAFQRGLDRCLSTGADPPTGTFWEVSALRANKGEFPVEVFISRIADSDPPRFTGFVRELTNQKVIEASAAHLATLVQCSDDSIVGTTLDGTVTSWNRGAEKIYGYSAGDMIGRNISLVFPADRPEELTEIRKRIGDGVSVKLNDAVRRRKDGRLIDVSLTISPMRDQAGKVIGMSAVARDVSDRRAIERSRAAEHAVVRALAESDSFADARERILQALGEQLNWDFGSVWEEDPDLKVLRCAATWCIAKSPPLRFERHSRQLMLPRGVGLPGRVWDTGAPSWITYPSCDGNFPRRETAAAEGLCSAFAFPILTRKSFYCVVESLSRECRQPDKNLLETMAHVGAQIGQFVERRRSDETLHGRQREMEVARQIQQRLLPQCSPTLAGFAIAATTDPAQETGGDLFDFLPLKGDALGVIVGDASGHGIGAALIITETRAYLRAFAAQDSNPGLLLERTNQCLVNDFVDEFVTVFFAKLDPADRSLTYSSAGHWPGYLLAADGEVKAQLSSTGIPLGLQSSAEFPASPVVRMVEGDILLLLTDGIAEAMSPEGELFGMSRVLELVRDHLRETPDRILAELSSRLEEFTGGRFLDDRTAVLIKAISPSSGSDRILRP